MVFLINIRLRDLRLTDILPLLPVLLFVFALNCLRGGGQIILRYGPIVILKQGIFRGVYYSAVIIELFLMSRLLTRGFSSEVLLGSLSSIDENIWRIFGRKKKRRNPFTILFYVLGIFQITYSELRVFFSRRERGLKKKVVRFFYSVFEKSLKEYETLKQIPVVLIKPKVSDGILIAAQILVFSCIYLIRRTLV